MGDSDENDVYMDEGLETAAERGDLSFLEEAVKREEESGDGNFHYFLRKTDQLKRNILQLGIRYHNEKWVEEALKLLPLHVVEQLLLNRDIYGMTALYHAALFGEVELMKVVDKYLNKIKNGDVDEITKLWGIANYDGDTALHEATKRGSVDAVVYLVDEYPDLASILNDSDLTFLHLAVKSEKVNFLKDLEYKIRDEDCKKKLWSMRNSKGNTALHLAASNGNTTIVKFIMEIQPQLLGFVTNYSGDTPLHSAASVELVQIIMDQHPQLGLAKNKAGDTPLHLAASNGNTEIVAFLMDSHHHLGSNTNNDGNTPLHSAAVNAATEVIEFLIQRHPDHARFLNYKKQTPLHLVITHYETLVDNTTKIEEILKIIKVLIQRASDVACFKDVDGFTPLHRATFLCTAYNVKVIRFILQHSSESAQVFDSSENTVLHLMVKRITSYQQGKDLLSIPKIKALSDTMNNQGSKPLDCAFETNIIMVRVLFDVSTKQSPATPDIPVATLIQQQNDLKLTEKQSVRMEEYEVMDEARIIKKLVHKFGMNFLRSRDSNKRNVLHKLLHMKTPLSMTIEAYVDFVHEILVIYPMLICQRDVNGDTPFHILMRNPPKVQIFSEGNDNSFHLSSTKTSIFLSQLFKLCVVYYKKLKSSEEGSHYDPPWLMTNIAGNTPFHESLIANCDRNLEKKLYELDIKIVAGLINKNKETPLHLLARRSSSKLQELANDTETLIKAYAAALNMQDKDGLYPFDRAIRVNNLGTITAILASIHLHPETMIGKADCQTLLHKFVDQSTPQSIYFFKYLLKKVPLLKDNLSKRNQKGQTPLHLAIEHHYLEQARFFLEISCDKFEEHIRINVFKKQDHQGNTPLHLAIQGGHSKFVVDFFKLPGIVHFNRDDSRGLLSVKNNKGRTPLHLAVKQCSNIIKQLLQVSTFEELKLEDNEGNTPLHLALIQGDFEFTLEFLKCMGANTKVDDLLKIENKDGSTPSTLIGSKKEFPSYLEEFFMKEPNLVGYRSVYGIAHTEMKDYVNTMGVIAALLTTITFTAALSVPGGPKQDDGTPTLIKHASFQAFMFFDVLTMCLSTMVLFCLLWIMAARDGRKSVMLLDFSLGLLQISFYTTLLTFMTGVYAAIFPVEHWIAIYTVCLCSIIMLLMQKNIVINTLGPCMCKFMQHCNNGFMLFARYFKGIIWSNKLFQSQQEDHSAPV